MLPGRTVVMRRFSRGTLGWVLRTLGTLVAGVIGWTVDVAILWSLAVGLGVATPIAAACGVTASGGVNFVLNRAIHGGDEPRRHREFARYLGLFTLNLVLVAVSVPLIAAALRGLFADRGLELIAAKVVVTAVLLLFNSYAYRRWVFARRGADAEPGVQ